jgi:hypothetical protein
MAPRVPRLLGMLVVLTLVLAACNNGDDADEADAPDEPGVETDAPAADLDDDIAAEVNGEVVPREAVEERIDDALEADDELATQTEGEEGEQLLEMFQAQTLTVLVQTRIILQGAADMGIEPTEEDIAAAREELVADFGGEEELDDALAQAGMTEAALEDQLEGLAALNAVGDELVERGEVPEVPEDAEGMDELDPTDLALQQWLGEQVAAAEVVVHPDYGRWDPQSGQVLPVSALLPEMPEEQPAPEGDAPEGGAPEGEPLSEDG